MLLVSVRVARGLTLGTGWAQFLRSLTPGSLTSLLQSLFLEARPRPEARPWPGCHRSCTQLVHPSAWSWYRRLHQGAGLERVLVVVV